MSCARESGFRVQGGPRAARDVRVALADELGHRIAADRLRDLQLVVTEIVNNSVLHGRVGEDGWIAVELSFTDARLRGSVRDSGLQGDPVQRDPDLDNGGGFGLFIVDTICSEWGVEHDPALTVWFELALDAAR